MRGAWFRGSSDLEDKEPGGKRILHLQGMVSSVPKYVAPPRYAKNAGTTGTNVNYINSFKALTIS